MGVTANPSLARNVGGLPCPLGFNPSGACAAAARSSAGLSAALSLLHTTFPLPSCACAPACPLSYLFPYPFPFSCLLAAVAVSWLACGPSSSPGTSFRSPFRRVAAAAMPPRRRARADAEFNNDDPGASGSDGVRAGCRRSALCLKEEGGSRGWGSGCCVLFLWWGSWHWRWDRRCCSHQDLAGSPFHLSLLLAVLMPALDSPGGAVSPDPLHVSLLTRFSPAVPAALLLYIVSAFPVPSVGSAGATVGVVSSWPVLAGRGHTGREGNPPRIPSGRKVLCRPEL